MEILHLAINMLHQFLRVHVSHVSRNNMLSEVVAIHATYLPVILHSHHWVDNALQSLLYKTATTKIGSSLHQRIRMLLQLLLQDRRLRIFTVHLGIMHTIILTSYDSASVIGLHKRNTSLLQLFSQTWSNHIRRHGDILALEHIINNNISHLAVRHDTHRLIPTRKHHFALACQLSLYDTSLPLYFTHGILGFISLVATG